MTTGLHLHSISVILKQVLLYIKRHFFFVFNDNLLLKKIIFCINICFSISKYHGLILKSYSHLQENHSVYFLGKAKIP